MRLESSSISSNELYISSLSEVSSRDVSFAGWPVDESVISKRWYYIFMLKLDSIKIDDLNKTI
jgi:hypothetical protein